MRSMLLATTAVGLTVVAGAAFAQDYNPNLSAESCAGGYLGTHTSCFPAHANNLNGGGSTLALNEYYRTLKSANAAGLVTGYLFNSDTTGSGSPTEVYYPGTGSGAGQGAFLSQNLASQSFALSDSTDGLNVDFGASDAFFSSSQLSSFPGSTLNQVGGALIQLPAFGTAVAIPARLSNVGGKKYTTTVVMTDNDLCGIFSGLYSDLNQIDHAKNLKLSGAFNVVYRQDGSGTTFLTTQHLAAVCNASNTAPGITFTATKQFSDIFKASVSSPGGVIPATFAPANGVTGFFVPGSGSPGVANAMLATTNAIGYLTPDYTSIATSSIPNSTIVNGTYTKNASSQYLNLKASSVINSHNGLIYTPSTGNTTTALSHPNLGGGDTTVIVPPNPTDAANPAYWIPKIADPLSGYPIVGYTTLDFAQCYATTPVDKGAIIKGWLEQLYGAKVNGVTHSNKTNLSLEGFVGLPTTPSSLNLNSAVIATFLTNAQGYNLDINNATACAGKTGLN